jgi:transcriptional regulator GlxA family with amidase domain
MAIGAPPSGEARVYDQRVARAAGLLAKAGAAHPSVTEVASACGFNDASHFGRAFVARMHRRPPGGGSRGEGRAASAVHCFRI